MATYNHPDRPAPRTPNRPSGSRPQQRPNGSRPQQRPNAAAQRRRKKRRVQKRFYAFIAVLVVLMLSIAFLLWKYQKQVLHLVGQFVEKRKYRNGTKTADLSESRRV